MNIKRAIGFAFLLYISSFIVFTATAIILGIDLESLEGMSTMGYVIGWVLYIPIVLLLAKWYFKKDPPTLKKGFWLGVIAITTSLLFDGVSVLGTYFAGESLDIFVRMYSSWEFYVSVVWVILLCTFAGFEFDKTFTKQENGGDSQ